ncbi:MAG: DUF4401 domain-containing protein [Cohaesibacter sp.]|jgi:hypothetical protein|nr:DUF4401 domain-containing protein [Cohaesibacter sp.]
MIFSSSSRQITGEDLSRHLLSQGLLGKEDAEKLEYSISNEQAKQQKLQDLESPLYLRLLVGIGAVLASLFFLAALFIAGIWTDEPAFLGIMGLIGMGAAIALYRNSRQSDPQSGDKPRPEHVPQSLRQVFFDQVSLTLMVAAKCLIVVAVAIQLGWSSFFDQRWLIPSVLALLTASSYHLYPLPLERLMGCLATLISLWVVLFETLPASQQIWAFHGFVLLHCLGCAFYLEKEADWQQHSGLFDSLLLSLTIGLAYFTARGLFMVAPKALVMVGPFPLTGHALSIAAGLGGLILWFGVQRRASWRQPPILLALLGVLFLGILSQPGILLAIGLMMLGYAMQNKAYSLLGLLALLAFLFHYYYALDVTLLAKSLILVLSGSLFLAAAAFLRWKGWHQATEPRPDWVTKIAKEESNAS